MSSTFIGTVTGAREKTYVESSLIVIFANCFEYKLGNRTPHFERLFDTLPEYTPPLDRPREQCAFSH